jgi:hypothetical protein
MDPVTLAAVVGVLVALAFAFVGGFVLLWVLRKTMALVKRLVFLGVGLVVLAALVAAGVALTAYVP